MASYVDNVMEKMASTPTFRPSNLNTFGDWSIEAGDVIAAVVDGVSEVVPVFNSDMSWHGAADVQLGASGNLQREVQDRLERTYQQYFGGLYEDIKDVAEEAYKIRTGLEEIAEQDEEGNWALAESKVIASISDADGNAKEAFLNIKVTAEKDGGTTVTESLATLIADVIKLTGDVYIQDGKLVVEKSIHAGTAVFANAIGSRTGKFIIGTSDIYEPEDITYIYNIRITNQAADGHLCGEVNGVKMYLHYYTNTVKVLKKVN